MQLKSNLIYLVASVLVGALIPIQAATNTAFSKSAGNPLYAGLMVFVVGFIAMVFFVFAAGIPLPTMQKLSTAPMYSYLGGLIVAFYVIMITILVPRLGVGTAIAFIVTGQIFCTAFIDHFGFFNVPPHSISLGRVAGMLLMVIGVFLVMKK